MYYMYEYHGRQHNHPGRLSSEPILSQTARKGTGARTRNELCGFRNNSLWSFQRRIAGLVHRFREIGGGLRLTTLIWSIETVCTSTLNTDAIIFSDGVIVEKMVDTHCVRDAVYATIIYTYVQLFIRTPALTLSQWDRIHRVYIPVYVEDRIRTWIPSSPPHV